MRDKRILWYEWNLIFPQTIFRFKEFLSCLVLEDGCVSSFSDPNEWLIHVLQTTT